MRTAVARSLSVSANVCRRAEALFPDQGKQILDPFANEKRRSRAGCGGVKRCLAWQGRPVSHICDFSSVKGKCRELIQEEKLNACMWEKITISPTATQRTGNVLWDIATGCWRGTIEAVYSKVRQIRDEARKGEEMTKWQERGREYKERILRNVILNKSFGKRGTESKKLTEQLKGGEGWEERETRSHSRHAQCCLFCVKVNDKRGMKSAEKGKTTARLQSPPSQLIQLHAGISNNGPVLVKSL